MMKQAMGYRPAKTKRDVFNEFNIFVQAIWRLSTRALANSLGMNKRGWGKKPRTKSQARYQQNTKQVPSENAGAPKKMKDSQLAAKEETLPVGTLTEIRSIAYLNEQSQNLQRDLQQGLTQILPALAGFCQQRWLVLVAPPCLPSVDELKAAGIDPQRVLVVHSATNSMSNSGTTVTRGSDILEQMLRSGTCGAVLAWLEQGDAQTLDRLRLAAEAGHAWGVLFRTGQQSKRAQIPAAPQVEGAQIKMAMS